MTSCPRCQSPHSLVKKGSFLRASDQKKIPRYLCRFCGARPSRQWGRLDYRHRKRHVNQAIFRTLCLGVSQRRCAWAFATTPRTIARRVVRFGAVARAQLAAYRAARPLATHVMLDEMESFVHTKMKPLTMPIAVEAKTRKILSLAVGAIPAKGPLAARSRAKYGPRPCERARVLAQVLGELQSCCTPTITVSTDQSQHYPRPLRRFFPQATHRPTKGRRGCVVGQGELKRGGFDPLFALNHTYAMIRDHVKRLSRRTWCTTKRPERLEDFLAMYAYFHNAVLDQPRQRVVLRSVARTS